MSNVLLQPMLHVSQVLLHLVSAVLGVMEELKVVLVLLLDVGLRVLEVLLDVADVLALRLWVSEIDVRHWVRCRVKLVAGPLAVKEVAGWLISLVLLDLILLLRAQTYISQYLLQVL